MSPLIGILGGGQLARMLALAGHPLGLRFRVLDPSPEAPAAAVAEHIRGDYTDREALVRFSEGLDVITYEFENIPLGCIHHLMHIALPTRGLQPRIPIYPPPQALQTGQDRLTEKTLFRSLGIGVAGFADIGSLDDLRVHSATLGRPCILKTRRMGYDGKGQVVVASDGGDGELERAWKVLGPSLAGCGLILEEFIPFIAEASMLAVRSPAGEIRTYPLIRNEHSSGILRCSRAPFSDFVSDLPADIDARMLQSQASAAAIRILESLEYVGVLAVEFFVQKTSRGYELLASEIAPRVHNSGHWTIEGSVCGQFENHLRAICGMPLGETLMRFAGASASMSNLVGGWPDPADVLAIPGAHLHLYGKQARPGRKVGHATVVGLPEDVAGAAPRLQSRADEEWVS